jgi:uncharacterized protein
MPFYFKTKGGKMNHVIVKESGINGKGVFATKNFKKGEVVIDWSESPVLTKAEAKKVPQKEHKYLYYVDDNKQILVTTPARYVNHSCDPNTFIKGFYGLAKKDIMKGEEITEDYTKENNPEFSLKCNCGSKNCKGIIGKVI